MKLETFNRLLREAQDREAALLDHKRDEYAGAESDVLRNFKTLSHMTGLLPEQVAAIYLCKHVQAIAHQVMGRSYFWGWQAEDGGGEGLKQRIDDARNYLLLLAACIEEQSAEGDL